MDGLKGLRDDIDRVDRRIVELFEERMQVVIQVAEYKKNHDTPILNVSRENEVIKKCCAMLKDKSFEESLIQYMKKLMELSKNEQVKYMNKCD